jgi:Protein of unknown function (DUF1552)
MSRSRLSRRAMLKSLGLGLGALPLMHTSTGRGATATGPKRLVIVYQTGGMYGAGFWPQGTGNDLTQLTFPNGSSPLKPHASNLIFVKGLWNRAFIDPFPPYSAPRNGCGPKSDKTCLSGDAHSAYGTLFTGRRARLENNAGDPRGFMYSYPTGPSVDQYIAQKLATQGAPLPMVLGVAMSQQPEHITGTRASWKAEGQPVGPEDDTFKLFDKYLAGRGAGVQTPDPALERLRAEKRSILDYVGRDLERFGQQVGTDYQEKVQAHLGAVRDLEKIISASPTSATGCYAAPRPAQFNPADIGQYDKIIDAQYRFLAAALACDVTRVAFVQLNNSAGDQLVFNWLGISGGGQEFPVRNYHDVQHRPGTNGADKIKVENWYLGQFAKLLDQMKAVKEGDRTMLDNSVVLYASHAGSNPNVHGPDDLPWILAGSCGGYFKTGRMIRLTQERAPVNGVLAGLCNAMGVPSDTFGDAEYGGEYAELRG